MSTRAFQQALIQLPLSQQERASLTSDELFVLIAAGRLHGLTKEEQQRLAPGDLRELASAGLIENVQASVAYFHSGCDNRLATIRRVPAACDHRHIDCHPPSDSSPPFM